MVGDRPQRVKEILSGALAVAREERSAYLDESCAGDDATRREVEALLTAHEDAGDFLDTPAFGEELGPEDVARFAEPEELLVGDRINGWRIQRVIASGGMGTVYEAAEVGGDRVTALKLMRPGVASPAAMHRFRLEAEVLSHLQHDGIARIFEIGTHDDGTGVLPFFVMEYIAEAQQITEYADASELDLRERLNLFAQVCDAVHHGHQKGIIHRDLKPANILVDGEGTPKVIDFGVARATDSDLAVTNIRTGVGQLIGTLQYMSPEQCGSVPSDIDIRSDVYSLGVVLYELLCGAVPYDVREVGVLEAVRLIREAPPRKPREVRAGLPGDVETILLKTLAKDREQRYDSAAALAGDVRRYLNNEPIAARPPSAVYLMRKFARRNRGLVAGVAVAVVALVGGTVLAINYAVGESNAREAEATQREESDRKSEELFAVNELLGDIVVAMSPDAETAESRTETTRGVLEEWAERLANEFSEAPLVRASLHHTIGDTYGHPLGMYAEAREHYERAFELRKEFLGPNHRDTLYSKFRLATALSGNHQHADAESLLREAIDAARLHLGPRDPFTRHAATHLIGMLVENNKAPEAIDLARANLEECRDLFGDDDFLTIVAKDSLASVLSDLYQYDEGIPLRREVLAWNQDYFGDDDHRTLSAMGHLGKTLLDANRNALEPRLDEATALFEKAVEIATHTLGPDHPVTLTYRGHLADCMSKEGKSDESEAALREVLNAQRAWYDGEHPEIAWTLHHLADVLRQQGHLDEAEELAREAVSIYDLQPDQEASRHYHALAVLGRVLFDRGRFDETMAVNEENLRLSLAHFGESNWRTVTGRANIGSAYQQSGRPAQAEPYFRAALPAVEARHGPDHKNTLVARNNLAASLRDQGKFEEAAAEYREVCRRAPNTYAANDSMPGMFKSGLGYCLLRLEEFQGAEELLLEAEERLEATTYVGHPWTRVTRERLVELYDAWNKPEQAEQWRARLAAAQGGDETD